MHRIPVLAALALAGCGGAARPPAPIGNDASSEVEWVDCPPGLGARYRLPPVYDDDVTWVRGCVRGRFGDASLAAFIHVGGRGARSMSINEVWIAFLDADGVERAFDNIGHYGGSSMNPEIRHVADLDGDGQDEIVELTRIDGSSDISVLRKTGKTIELMAGLEQDGPDSGCLFATRLGASDALGLPSLVIITTADPDEDEGGECPFSGEWVYRVGPDGLELEGEPTELDDEEDDYDGEE